ncbi:hypothetical protein [Streptomyces qinglanensis]|uniref:Uncharacterized protein n=1 Tax=Streptomyces qinglanensis TaxID=943816 RepID=A0A1H9Q4E6_9ACTN|nr:hypothetical protein [Streptomyces qinglanensis]SER54723.1 hypothetical protein SAMN05421870_102424 [Streptomyces qinglanensis]
MFTESVLLESRSARSGMTHRIDALDDVKALPRPATGAPATTREVADYFDVPVRVVEALAAQHREELLGSGMALPDGAGPGGRPAGAPPRSPEQAPGGARLRGSSPVFSPRAMLTTAMLLRGSPTARRIRRRLLALDAAARAHPRVETVRQSVEELGRTVRTLAAGYGALDRGVGRLEATGAELVSVLRDLVPVVGVLSSRAERVDHRLAETERRTERAEERVCALSRRLADLTERTGAGESGGRPAPE